MRALRAVIVGLIVAAVPAIVWSVLVAVNLRTGVSVPWSAVVMAVLLWLFWRYYARNVRSTALTARTWGVGLLAGGTGVASLWALFFALQPFLPLAAPANDQQFPLATMIAAIVIAAAVAAIAEETGFRGVMQATLEQEWEPRLAIVATSLLFAAAHFTHGLGVIPMLPFYLMAGVVYGFLAWLTNSILPSLLLHFAGDVATFTLRFARPFAGRPSDGTTIVLVISGALLAIVSVFAFRLLAEKETSSGTTAPLTPVSRTE